MARKPKPKKRKIRIYDAGFGNDWINFDPPMGYTFDTKVKIPATANTTTNANPATGTITIADDADLLIVAMIYGGNATRTGGAPTANGTSLTQADAARTVTEAVAELWYLTAPSPGANVIVVPNTPTAKNLDIFVASFKAQSGYDSVFSSASGSATTAANPSITLRVPNTQSVVVSVVGHGANAWGPTSQSGTVVYNEDPSTWGGGSQFILNAPIGAVISAWTQASDDYGLVAAAFIEQQTLKSIADAGSGSDIISNLTKQNSVSISDAGQGSDTLSELSQSRSITETGKGTDDSQIGVSISISDMGYDVDNISHITFISISDMGTAIESITKQILVTITDTANAIYSGIGAEFPITPILDDFNRDNLQGLPSDSWEWIGWGESFEYGEIYNSEYRVIPNSGGDGVALGWKQSIDAIHEVYLTVVDALSLNSYCEVWLDNEYFTPYLLLQGVSGGSTNVHIDFYISNGIETHYRDNLLINFPCKFGWRQNADGTYLYIYQDGKWQLLKTLASYNSTGKIQVLLDVIDNINPTTIDNFGGGNLIYMDIPTISATLSISDVGLSADIAEIGIEYLYPTSDIANVGTWKNELGGSILYTSIDELIDPDDSDYVWIADANINDYFEVGLSIPQYLFDDGDVVIHWRGANHNLGVNTTIKVELREGNTVIASDEQTLSDIFTTYEHILTAGEVANIVDPTNLSIRFTVTGVS